MEEVLTSLNKRKSSFLNDVENNVRIYIESTGKQCIAVVEKAPNGGAILRIWEVHLNDLSDFCEVLYKFVRKRQYRGHDLDSALTEPISIRVENAYQEFYQSESDMIASGMLVMLAADEAKLISFAERITDIALDQLSSHVKKQVVQMVVHQVKESVNQGTAHAVATIVAHLLLKLLAANIGHIVAKLLASAFLQKVLAVLIKKFVLAAVTTAVLQFLATHVGIAIGGSTFMFVVVPLLVAYIGWQISTFPKKLGEKVSKKIRQELESRFESSNKTVLEKIFDIVFDGDELVQVIAKDAEFQYMLRNLGEKLQGQKDMLVSEKGKPIVLTTVADVYT